MKLQPKTARIAAALAAALLVVGIAFIAVTATLIRDAPEHQPVVTAYAYGHSVSVQPMVYCSIDLKHCTKNANTPTKLHVPLNYPLQLSLPEPIADAPWRIVMTFELSGERFVEVPQRYEPNAKDAVTVQSQPQQRLVGVEIQLPSGVVDQQNNNIARAFWSIKTA